MKLFTLVTLLLISLSQALNTSLLRKIKTKSKSKLIVPVKALAKIAHGMVYDNKEDQFFSDAAVIEENSFKVSYGLLIDSPTVVVIVFRGTVITKPTNLLKDLDIRQVVPDEVEGLDCSGCKVHKGFTDAYKSLEQKILEKLAQYLKKGIKDGKITQVIFTGHSLGGAMATLGCFHLSNWLKGTNYGIVTFGAPRVGNDKFKAVFDKKLNLSLNVRFTFNKDPIPTVPFKPDYVHCGTEYNFSDKENFSEKDYLQDTTLSAETTVAALSEFQNVSDHSQYKTITTDKIEEVLNKNHSHVVSDMAKK